MIIGMEIKFRSKEPINEMAKSFTTGGYLVNIGECEFAFDFEEMVGTQEIVDGYLHVCAERKNLDDDYIKKVYRIQTDNRPDITTEKISLEEADYLLKKVKKEDFRAILYECFSDLGETEFIPLEPISIHFSDYSVRGVGDVNIIEVGGEAFSNIESEAA